MDKREDVEKGEGQYKVLERFPDFRPNPRPIGNISNPSFDRSCKFMFDQFPDMEDQSQSLAGHHLTRMMAIDTETIQTEQTVRVSQTTINHMNLSGSELYEPGCWMGCPDPAGPVTKNLDCR
jgi:hypothetical protein